LKITQVDFDLRNALLKTNKFLDSGEEPMVVSIAIVVFIMFLKHIIRLGNNWAK